MIAKYPPKFNRQFCFKWDFIFFPPRGVEARPHSWPWVAKIKVGCDRFLNEDDNENEDEEEDDDQDDTEVCDGEMNEEEDHPVLVLLKQSLPQQVE